MKRTVYYDEFENVWRVNTPFGIIDDGIYPDFKKHRLRITSEEKYRKFDLISFCRDFKKQFGVAPNFIKGNQVALKSISEIKYNESDKMFEIAEFKMNVDLAPDDYRDDFLEISYENPDEIYFKTFELYQKQQIFLSDGTLANGTYSIDGGFTIRVKNGYLTDGIDEDGNNLPAIYADDGSHIEHWEDGLLHCMGDNAVIDKAVPFTEFWLYGKLIIRNTFGKTFDPFRQNHAKGYTICFKS